MKVFGAVPPFGEPSIYWKQVPTKAWRIDGPFMVVTSEGPLTCNDGYVCQDARGYLYPVAREEFDLIYKPDPPVIHE